MYNGQMQAILDAGATKTDLMFLNDVGKVIDEHKFGGGNISLLGVEKWVQVICQELRKSPQKVETVIAGISGLNSQSQINELHKIWNRENQDKTELIAMNDAVIGLLSGSRAKNATVLIAGTGASCWGFNGKGETKKVGGVDYFGDQGSGWEIGFQVLQAALAAVDGRQPSTILGELLAEKYQFSDWVSFTNSMITPSWKKDQVAELANLALSWQEENNQTDEVLQLIIDRAINNLAVNVKTVLQFLNLERQKTDLVLIGGIVTKHPIISGPLQKQLKDEFSELNIVWPSHPPISGAWELAQMIKNDPQRAQFYLDLI